MADLVIPIALVAGLLAMLAVYMVAARSNHGVRSRERAEREGARGEAGVRHAQQRADAEWIENSSPADTNEVRDVLGHTIADRGHARRPRD